MAKSEYRRQGGETIREAKNRYLRDWYGRNPDKRRAIRRRQRLKRYGLTEQTYQAILYGTRGRCPICTIVMTEDALRPTSAVIDHKGNVTRGILCNHCNQALGLFKDSLEVLDRAILYLQRGEDNG